MSTSAQQFSSSTQEHDRRRAAPREFPKSLIYVACGAANGGMVLNVSDSGMAISMAIAVGDETYKNLSVRMNGLPQSLEVRGRMAWTTASKKRAGIQLVDVSASQRERIREWIALDGVRDVNLMPRAEEPIVAKDNVEEKREPVAVIIPAERMEAVEVIAPAKAVEVAVPAPAETQSGEEVIRGSSPETFAPPLPSLLDLFGGTPPESLGPPLPERFKNEAGVLPSPGFGAVNGGAFRENEWDLASVTMVPRKKARPEGLSAVALILLWVAIPSFGMGILVGRKPLERWLATGKFTETQAPAPANAQSGAVAANENRGVPGLPKPVAVEPSQVTESATLEPPAATDGMASQVAEDSNRVDGQSLKDLSASAVSVGDSKLLNSLSTQEARALKNVLAKPMITDGASSSIATMDTSRDSASATARPSQAAAIKPVVPPVVVARNFEDVNRGAAAVQSVQPDNSRASGPKAVAISSNVSAPEGAKPAAPVNLPPANSTPASVPHVSVPTNSAPASSPNVATSHSSDSNMSSNGGKPALAAAPISPASPQSGGAGLSAGAPGVVTSTVTNSSVVAPGVGSMAATAEPARMNPAAVAAVSVQPPLHGTVMVARKSDESFLLKLPMEAVPADNSVATRMQRVVLVPARSRWHGHGPIAKVAVGELLTKVELDKPDASVKPRVGEAVTVRAYVDKNGSVEQLKPVSGRFALMPRVMRAVRDWQFDQTLIDGKAVDSEVDVTVEFRR